MSGPYGKIQSAYKRDPDNKFKTFLDGEWADPAFAYLANLPWVATEKVDGTNIRLPIDETGLIVQGRTDRADTPPFLEKAIRELVDPNLIPESVTLYGEGYGAKIQKGGGNYIPDGQSFVLFDVRGPDRWWERDEVDLFADGLGIQSVPVLGVASLNEWIVRCEDGDFSESVLHPGAPNEGYVLRPMQELRARSGRVITKLKFKDFA